MSFVSGIENIVDVVADWAVDAIEQVVNILAPDGRPFGYEPVDEEDQIENYLQLKGNPQAWTAFINERATKISQDLQTNGLQEDDILSVHPFDIAARYAMNYAAAMEAKLGKKLPKDNELAEAANAGL
jgi:hypothetical protein